MPTSFRLRLECNGLARMTYQGSSPFDKLRVPSPAEGRKRAEAKRDEHSEP